MPERGIGVARQARAEIQVIRTDLALLRGEVDDAGLNKVLERLAVLERRLDDLARFEPDLRRVAVVEDRVAELKKARDEADKRQWQFVYIFAGALASLRTTVVVQLVLAAVKK